MCEVAAVVLRSAEAGRSGCRVILYGERRNCAKAAGPRRGHGHCLMTERNPSPCCARGTIAGVTCEKWEGGSAS